MRIVFWNCLVKEMKKDFRELEWSIKRVEAVNPPFWSSCAFWTYFLCILFTETLRQWPCSTSPTLGNLLRPLLRSVWAAGRRKSSSRWSPPATLAGAFSYAALENFCRYQLVCEIYGTSRRTGHTPPTSDDLLGFWPFSSALMRS